MSNNNDLKRRLIAAFPVESWPEWAVCIAVDNDNSVYGFGGAKMLSSGYGRIDGYIDDFILQPGDDWRDTLTTREEAERISRPEFPDDWQHVLVKARRGQNTLVETIAYRYGGIWHEPRYDGTSYILDGPVVDWQYLPKFYTNE